MSKPIEVLWKRKSGSLRIEGRVIVRDEDGNIIEPLAGKDPERPKFCGCGHSETKPWCDGSHKKR